MLLGTWAEHDVRVAAGQKTLPFEEDFIAGVTDKVKEALEVALWQGDTTSLTPNLKYFDGMLKILANDADVIHVTIAAGSSLTFCIPVTVTSLTQIAVAGYDASGAQRFVKGKALGNTAIDRNKMYYLPAISF